MYRTSTDNYDDGDSDGEKVVDQDCFQWQMINLHFYILFQKVKVIYCTLYVYSHYYTTIILTLLHLLLLYSTYSHTPCPSGQVSSVLSNQKSNY